MGKLVLEADAMVNELESSIKKARCISDTMFNEFYTCEEPKTEMEIGQILYGFKYACIEHNIINDYLVKMQKDIEALIEIIGSIPVDKKEGDTSAE